MLGIYPQHRYNSYNNKNVARARFNSKPTLPRPALPKSRPRPRPRNGKIIDKCEYYKAIGTLEEHPECLRCM